MSIHKLYPNLSIVLFLNLLALPLFNFNIKNYVIITNIKNKILLKF